MRASPFDPEMADVVAGWPASASECEAWCSSFSVTGEEVVAWTAAPDTEALVLIDREEPVAYGEIWVGGDESEVELAHLIVAPGRRGAGVGRTLVGALSDRGFELQPMLVLRVRPDNVAAQRCYAAAGFTRVRSVDEVAWNVGQPVEYVWMSRIRP